MRYATCDPDYSRRVQLMMLGPQSQFNAWQHGDVPWHCNGTYWRTFKDHYDLRLKLAPYLYTGQSKQQPPP